MTTTTTTTTTVPTESGWAEAQRYRLRLASRATRSQRQRRTDVPAHVAVLLAILGAGRPVSLRPGWLGEHTGMTAPEVAEALGELHALGLIEPGSDSSRVGFLVPDVLDALGVVDHGISLAARSDQPSPGAEASEDELAAAFAGGVAA